MNTFQSLTPLRIEFPIKIQKKAEILPSNNKKLTERDDLEKKDKNETKLYKNY